MPISYLRLIQLRELYASLGAAERAAKELGYTHYATKLNNMRAEVSDDTTELMKERRKANVVD